jgi:hypothetical protein
MMAHGGICREAFTDASGGGHAGSGAITTGYRQTIPAQRSPGQGKAGDIWTHNRLEAQREFERL